MSIFVHDMALVETSSIGDRTRVGAFSHVLPLATIGEDCVLEDGVSVEGGVAIGNRVEIRSGARLCSGTTVEDEVFVGPNTTIAPAPNARWERGTDSAGGAVVRRGACLEAGCTILRGVEIGEGAVVKAGAVVTTTVPRHAIVAGHLARIIGYTDPNTGEPLRDASGTSGIVVEPGTNHGDVRGVTLTRFPVMTDLRGSLTAAQYPDSLPFAVERCFLVFDVPTAEVRGEHAHRECHQFLIAVHGSLSVIADDGLNRQEFRLNSRETGLYLPPMTWGIQYRYSTDAVLLVLASHPYDASDYIRDYDEFIALAGNSRRSS